MTRPYTPDWNKRRAQATFKKYMGKRYRRPQGQAVYELVCVNLLPGVGWGIVVRRIDKNATSYIICHNALAEEGWVEVVEPKGDNHEASQIASDSGVV
jgi:hypothetical protein